TCSVGRYLSDRQIFPNSAQFSYDELLTRARQSTFLVPGLKITVRDERMLPGTPVEEGPVEEVFKHEGGVLDFVEFLAADAAVTDTWLIKGNETFTETVQVLGNNGHLNPKRARRQGEWEI